MRGRPAAMEKGHFRPPRLQLLLRILLVQTHLDGGQMMRKRARQHLGGGAGTGGPCMSRPPGSCPRERSARSGARRL